MYHLGVFMKDWKEYLGCVGRSLRLLSTILVLAGLVSIGFWLVASPQESEAATQVPSLSGEAKADDFAKIT